MELHGAEGHNLFSAGVSKNLTMTLTPIPPPPVGSCSSFYIQIQLLEIPLADPLCRDYPLNPLPKADEIDTLEKRAGKEAENVTFLLSWLLAFQ